MNKYQLDKLEYIKNQPHSLKNKTKCVNCDKWIDITKDEFMFGTSLNKDFIYCSERCNSYYFSRMMF